MYPKMLILVLFALLAQTCLEDNFEPLEGNLFAASTDEPFEITNINRDTLAGVRADITITFINKYDLATPVQRALIRGLRIRGLRNGRDETFPPDISAHVLTNVRFDWQNCLLMSYTLEDGEELTQHTVCFEPED
jgi:hypothetical protein